MPSTPAQPSPLDARELAQYQSGRGEVEVLLHDLAPAQLKSVLHLCLSCFAEEDFEETLPACEKLSRLCANLASQLNRAFERAGPWQVIVGDSYGTFLTHQNDNFLTFRFAGLLFTLFVSP